MRPALARALLIPVLLMAVVSCADGSDESNRQETAMSNDAGTPDDPARTGGEAAAGHADAAPPASRDRGVSAPAPTEMPTDPAEPDRADAPSMSDPLPPTRRTCNADAAAGHVGREATPDVVSAAQRDAGASSARVLKPGQMVTMEYIEGRLNIDVDANNVITGIRCG